MNVLMWMGLGLLAGGFASRFFDDTVEDSLLDIMLGVIGALFTGFLLYEFGGRQAGIDIFQVFTLLLSSVFFILVRKNIRTR